MTRAGEGFVRYTRTDRGWVTEFVPGDATIAEFENEAERLARSFHRHYERLAPEYGYEVRPDVGQRHFDDLPDNNRCLMLATARAVLNDLIQGPTS